MYIIAIHDNIRGFTIIEKAQACAWTFSMVTPRGIEPLLPG